MPRHRLAKVLLVGCLTGCGRPTLRATAAAPEAALQRPSGETPTQDESRVLCLAEPRGATTPVDRDLRALQVAAQRLPTQAESWVRIGRQWVRTARLASDPGFYLNVNACAAVALAVDPEATAALELRMLALMNDHAFEAARSLAAEILSRDPENFVALGGQSDALLELGRYDEAAQAAQRQMNTLPGTAAYARVSYLRWLHGDESGARRLIRDALVGRDPNDPEAAAWMLTEAAALYWHAGDYAGADALYAEALKRVPDYVAALVGRGRTALARADAKSAASFFEKAYQKRPLAETAWWLADACAAAGDAAAARDAAARVVQQGRRGDRLTLAAFYAAKDRDIPEALQLIEAERRSRGGIHVDDVYAWVLYRAGRTADARTAAERAIRLGTKDARLFYHAGAIRLKAGDASGRGLVEKALALNPAFDWTGAAEARALLRDTRRSSS